MTWTDWVQTLRTKLEQAPVQNEGRHQQALARLDLLMTVVEKVQAFADLGDAPEIEPDILPPALGALRETTGERVSQILLANQAGHHISYKQQRLLRNLSKLSRSVGTLIKIHLLLQTRRPPRTRRTGQNWRGRHRKGQTDFGGTRISLS